ncbi:MAG TPA: mycothione reductase [Acidimicrobiaceae bacterium]|nr:mycothione reductase [Actinomycetota bacterium]HAZ32675.1 mycothione reductase [Acidimicrobiaceae bacterium]
MSENGDTFDLIIIGSGSGNHIPEFLNDWRIAMVERDVFGGTCLNRGCIPSKMLVLPADRAVEADEARSLGVDITVNGADWLAIRDRVFGRIDPISESGRGYRAERCENVTLIEGTGQFVRSEVDGMHAVDVDGRRITAPNVLVAVGSRPSLPPIAGLQECGFHTSDSIMRLDTFPSRLGIIGGGYIAAEMGHVFSGLGSEVTLFNRSATMLSRHDSDIATTFTEEFRRRVSLQLGHLPSKVERTSQGIEMHCDGNIIIVDELLLATGREPNSDLLNCDLVGLETNSRGIVTVDSQMRTSVPGIWAIGDVANEHQLKHVANAEVDVAFWNMAHADDQQVVTQRHVPAAVFSHPQVASVGLTEQAASAENRDVVIGRREYAGTAYGWALGDGPGFAKVIVDCASDEILGAHIIGPQAATLIQPLVQAMQFSQTATQVARDVYYIHPALTEVIENALLDAIGQR